MGPGGSHPAAGAHGGRAEEGVKDSRWEWRPPAGTWPSCAAPLAASAAGAAAAAACRARGVRLPGHPKGARQWGGARVNVATHPS